MKKHILKLSIIAFLGVLIIFSSPKVRDIVAQNALNSSGHIAITGNGQLVWSNSPNNLSLATYGHQAVVFKNYLYILGGANNNRISRTTLFLDRIGITENWDNTNLMPRDIMYYHSAVTDGERIYLIGGNNGTVAMNTVYYTTPNADGQIITWTQNSAFLPSFLEQHESFIYNGYLYVAGGLSSSNGASKDTVYVGKINTNGSISGFKITTPLPVALNKHRMIVIGDRVYLVGGYNKQGDNGLTINKVYSTGFKTDGELVYPWREEASLSRELYRHSLGYFGNKVYVFGGLSNLNNIQRVVYFAELDQNGSINSWQEDANLLPYAVNFHETVQYNSSFYLLGGHIGIRATNNVLVGQSLISDQEKDVSFPITITGMDKYGQIDLNYRSNTYINAYKEGHTFYIKPTFLGSGTFNLGSAKVAVKIWPAGNKVVVKAKQEGVFGVEGQSKEFNVKNLNPVLNSIVPNSGYNNISITVDILGDNFYQDGELLPKVQIGSFILRHVELISKFHLRAVVPKGLASGVYNLVVTNPDGKIAVLENGYEILDAAASATFVINNGERATKHRVVKLHINSQNPPNGSIELMRFSNNGIHFSNWESYATEKNWDLTAGLDGVRTVYVQFRDTLNNESGIFSDTIIYDTTPPVINYDNIKQLPDSPEDSPTINGKADDAGSGISRIIWEIWKTNGYEVLGSQPVVSGSANYYKPSFEFTVPVSLPSAMYRVHVYAYDWAENVGHNAAHPMVFTVTGNKSFRKHGSITGVVTNHNKGLENIYIYVYSSENHNNLVRLTRTSSVIAGQYIADNLPTGTYKVGFQGEPLKGEWFYGYSNSFSNARIVEVTAPYNSDNINFEITHVDSTISTYTPTVIFSSSPSATPTPIFNWEKAIVINNEEFSTTNYLVNLRFNPPAAYKWTKVWLSNNNKDFRQKVYQAEYFNWRLESDSSGVKRVYVIFEDNNGHQSATFSDSIFLKLEESSTPSVTPKHTLNHFRAQYYNNSLLYGKPVFEREEGRIDYNWGYSSPLYPKYSASKDFFSIRWTGEFDFKESGYYRFISTTDDGVRVWVDHDLVIDKWQQQPSTSYSALVKLAKGVHTIKMEYYEYTGLAKAFLSWELTDNSLPNQFLGQYYDNSYLLGRPVFTRYDNEINFDWGISSPIKPYKTSAHENFSVRWIGDIVVSREEVYMFKATCDDGCRVWVNNDLIINEWRAQPPTTYIRTKKLLAGKHQIWMEYQQIGGIAVAKLDWFSQW